MNRIGLDSKFLLGASQRQERLNLERGLQHLGDRVGDQEFPIVTPLGSGVVCSVNRFGSVFPIQRGLRSWNKWRIYLGSVLATPHILWNLFTALGSHNRYRELIQRILKN